MGSEIKGAGRVFVVDPAEKSNASSLKMRLTEVDEALGYIREAVDSGDIDEMTNQKIQTTLNTMLAAHYIACW